MSVRGLFAVPDYWRGWTLGMMSGVTRWLEFLAIGVFAYELTGSPQLVALLAIVRVAPYALLGFFVGTLSDRIDRKRWLQIMLLGMCVVSATMAVLSATGQASYAAVVVTTLATGIYWVSDMPFRRRSMLDAVGVERSGRAMGFDNITNYVTRGLGPLIGGVTYQMFGATGVFGLNFCAYVLCFILASGLSATPAHPRPAKAKSAKAARTRNQNAAASMRTQNAAASTPNTKVSTSNTKTCDAEANVDRGGGADGASDAKADEAPSSLLSNPRFQVILGITMIYNLFCVPFIGMLPVFAKRDFGFEAAAVGSLAAFEGVGGLIGALVLGFVLRPPYFFVVYFCGPLIYLTAILGVSFFLTPEATTMALIVLSFGGACFSATQYALIYTTAVPALRGRAFGFLSICIGCATVGYWIAGSLFKAFPSAQALQIQAQIGLVCLAVLAVYAVFKAPASAAKG